MSIFNYCPVIWMFCGKVANNKIDKIQKKALQALYDDFLSSHEELLRKGNHLTIHEMNKRHLLIQVYKCINKENPSFLNELFETKNPTYNLRTKSTLSLPKTSTLSWGLHSVIYRGSRSWNSLPDDIKNSSSSKKFKSLIQDIKLSCTCKLCSP